MSPYFPICADGHFNGCGNGDVSDLCNIEPSPYNYGEVVEYNGGQAPQQNDNGQNDNGAQQQNGQQGQQNQQGINNQLKYKTVTGNQHSGPWEIKWSLKHNTRTGGWIVQHIVADFAGAGHYDYYDEWSVAPNSHTPSIQGVDGNGTLYSDMFSGGAGSHIHGSARFFEGLNLPDSFTVHPPGFPAGNLRSTTTNPNLPTDNATAPNVRWWGIP